MDEDALQQALEQLALSDIWRNQRLPEVLRSIEEILDLLELRNDLDVDKTKEAARVLRELRTRIQEVL